MQFIVEVMVHFNVVLVAAAGCDCGGTEIEIRISADVWLWVQIQDRLTDWIDLAFWNNVWHPRKRITGSVNV